MASSCSGDDKPLALTAQSMSSGACPACSKHPKHVKITNNETHHVEEYSWSLAAHAMGLGGKGFVPHALTRITGLSAAGLAREVSAVV
jgi:hypothetical protein